MAWNMAVFWKIVRILAETSTAAECSLDDTHRRFCDKREHIQGTLEAANRRQRLHFISKADIEVFWLHTRLHQRACIWALP